MSAERIDPRAIARVLPWLALVTSGFSLAVLFHSGYWLPLQGGILLLAIVALVALAVVRVSRLSLLPRFMLLVYCMPFSVLLGYLLNPDFAWHYTEHGMNITRDPVVIRQLVTMGLIGLLGLFAGMRWAAIHRAAHERRDAVTPGPTTGHTLADPVYYLLIPVAVLLSWLSAPRETIFQAVYAAEQSDAISATINFPAAYVLSYIIIVVLLIDAERESLPSRRLTKLVAVGAATAYIVVVLQVMRGDRESAGLIVAITALYLTSRAGIPPGASIRSVTWRRVVRILVPMAAIVILFIALGALRSTASQASAVTQVLTTSEIIQLGLAQNTWTAVLWTNLSLAWEYRELGVTYKYGQTYLDYLLSLPPGFLTQLLGYERPLEAWQGIGWEDAARISAGGLHPVVAPFRNFGAFGVFFILMAYGYLIARVEQKSEAGTLWARILWASVFCAGFNWFWYGDMPFIRALMFAVILFYLYRIALSIRIAFEPPRGAGLGTYG